MEMLKVSSKSNPNSVAGALAVAICENGKAEVQVIGAGAVNQALKAVAIARGIVAASGVDLICVPAIVDLLVDGEERTALKLVVEPRQNLSVCESLDKLSERLALSLTVALVLWKNKKEIFCRLMCCGGLNKEIFRRV